MAGADNTYDKRPRGRPLKIQTISEQRPYTMSGLAHALGISRQTLLDYGDREEFLNATEDTKEKVHRFAEEHSLASPKLVQPSHSRTTGAGRISTTTTTRDCPRFG